MKTNIPAPTRKRIPIFQLEKVPSKFKASAIRMLINY
jgi:hypothetical protein